METETFSAGRRARAPSIVREREPPGDTLAIRMLLTSPHFDGTEIEALRECFASGWVTQGPLTERFEGLVGELHDARHAIATTSATAALHLSCAALGLGPGDEVIVPAFTWITSANAAEY